MQRPSREQLIEMAIADPEAIADLVLRLWDRIEQLEKRITELEANSRNSSKPPSTDKGNFTNPPKPKSLRVKTGKKTGGQPGHPGSTLQQTQTPDEITEHRLGLQCPCCQASYPQTSNAGKHLPEGSYRTRQVFELPSIRLHITEHRAQQATCKNCGTLSTADFPVRVNAPVQYGPRLQSTALYLGQYQLIPYQRLSELFAALFNAPLSQGTLANIITRSSGQAKYTMEPIREAILGSPVAHADETGCRLHQKTRWLHVLSTPTLTHYHIDAKRGIEGMKRGNLLGRYTGALIHDCLSAYFHFETCSHYLCNAHLQRELIYLHEQNDQAWAGRMIDLLVEAKTLSDAQKANPPKGRDMIDKQTTRRIFAEYDAICREGKALHPEPPPNAPGIRGRRKKSKELNLLNRLVKRREQIMGYFRHEHIPYDNNQAERDIRMVKVREKISGSFRSHVYADAYSSLRGIISTVRKQSRPMIDSLENLLTAPSTLGLELANYKPPE